MSNQGGVQAAIRTQTGTALDYNGDWHALFDSDGVATGPFNGRLLQWINQKLGTSFASLPQAQQALAVSNGFNNWSSMSTLSLYETEASALFARMTTPPTAARKTAVNDMIVALKAAGVWSNLEVLQVYSAADSQAALLNWVSTSYNATAVSSPTFTADRGFATNGSSSYINTGFGPSGSSLSGLDDSSLQMWVNKARQRPIIWGVGAVANQSILYAAGDTSYFGSLNVATAGADTLTVEEVIHYMAADRYGAATSKIYGRDVTSSVLTRASLARPISNLFLGAQSNNGGVASYAVGDHAAFAYGKSLGDAGHAALKSALRTYMIAVGNFLYPLACWGDSRTDAATQTNFPTQVRTNSSNRRIAYNGGVSGNTSTQIKTRFLANTRVDDYVQVIWAGYNNHTDTATVLADIAAMVADANSRSGGRYLVLTIPAPRDASFYPGTTPGDAIALINSTILSTYGTKAVNVNTALYAGDPNNVIAAANVINTVTDYVHMNTTGLGLVAADIETACVANGW